MRKPRSDSNWSQLSAPQRETMEKWLFDGHLSYDDTSARVKDEFGLEVSPQSIGRYYRRRLRERQVEDLVEARALSDAVADGKLDTAAIRSAAIKLVAKITLKLASERPEQLKDLEALTKVLLMSEDNDIRRGRLKLEQEQFHYQAASAAGQELPKLAGLLQDIENDEFLDEEAKLNKVHGLLYPDAVRLAMNNQIETLAPNAS